MHIDDMISSVNNPSSKLELANKRHKLKKDIQKAISEIDGISIDALKDDLHQAISLDGLKMNRELDGICAKYDLPVDGTLKIAEFLSASYYFAHMEEIFLLWELYSLDKESFSSERQLKFSNIYIIHTGMLPIFERAATDKHFDIITAKLRRIELSLEKLRAYRELIRY